MARSVLPGHIRADRQYPERHCGLARPGAAGAGRRGADRRLRTPLLAALRERGVPALRVSPNRLAAFRRSRAITAKTDRIDPGLILAFAADLLARQGVPAGMVAREGLRELAARRRQLAAALHAERCRLDVASAAGVRDSPAAIIAALRHSLDAIEEAIARAIRRPRPGRIGSAPAHDLRRRSGGGGGRGYPARRAVRIGPAVRQADRRARRPGTAHPAERQDPLAREHRSWPTQGASQGASQGAPRPRPAPGQALFNAARSAIAHPSPFRDFYHRLAGQNGRPGKVARVAVMRKILITANALARDRQPWRAAGKSRAPARPRGNRQTNPGIDINHDGFRVPPFGRPPE
jgi:transposase